MFKNMLKRSWLSTIRKPSRTIIMLILLFVMANMLLATISIKKSVQSSMDYAKQKLGGIVYLQADAAAMQKKVEAAVQAGKTPSITAPTINKSLADGIAKSQYIKDYTYSVTASGNASGFKTVTTTQNAREQQFQKALDNAKSQASKATKDFNNAKDNFNQGAGSSGSSSGQGQGRPFGGMRRFAFNFDLNISDPTLTQGDTTIQGINNFNYVSGVESGSISLLQGKTYDANTKNPAIISSEVATTNKLKVGSKITLKTVSDSKTITLTVVGIYKATSTNFDYNTLYTNIKGVESFMTAAQIKKETLSNVKFYLTSAIQKDAFLKETAKKYPNITKDGLKLDVDDSTYQTMVGPIENVGSFATTIMWLVIIAAVVIITLIVVMNVKERRYEMGVLMSLGAKRTNIMAQIFLELVIVATLAFILSIGTGQVLANKMGDALMKQQVTTTQQTNQNNGRGNGGGGFVRMMRGNNNDVQQIKTIDVNPDITDYGILFGAGYLILIFAMVIPSINILRYQPKTILTGKE